MKHQGNLNIKGFLYRQVAKITDKFEFVAKTLIHSGRELSPAV